MKTQSFFLFFLIFTLTGCTAPSTSAPTPVPTATNPPAPTPTESPTSTPTPSFDTARYGQAEKNTTYCTLQEGMPQAMDVYFPSSGGPWPAVLYVHGGSWIEGDKAEGEGWRYLNDSGFLVASLNYRLSAYNVKFPAMIEDIKCAVRYLRAHAGEYNLDVDHIGVIGASAGGHLVALMGVSDESAGWDVGEYLDQSSRVQAVIDMSGFSDLTIKIFKETDIYVYYAFKELSGKDTPGLTAASPVTYITADDPPFLIFHGDKDGVVPLEQAQVLQTALEAAGVPSQLVIVKNGSHALTGANAEPTQEQMSAMMLEFLEKYLK